MITVVFAAHSDAGRPLIEAGGSGLDRTVLIATMLERRNVPDNYNRVRRKPRHSGNAPGSP